MRLAVVGLGPRGLAAVEVLTGLTRACEIDLFDPEPFPGTGPNFRPDEDETCLLNLPLRSLDIGSARFAGVAEVIGPMDRDTYPPRRAVGRFLAGRWQAVAAQPGHRITHHREQITAARHDGGWWLHGATGPHGPYDELLLTQGQPATAPDPQLAAWRAHAAQGDATLLPAYPTAQILRAAPGWRGKTVAIRGLALSTLDVIALLTLGQGGRMSDGCYIASGREPGVMLPFSLDGMAPAPKPVDARADALFSLTRAEEAALADALAQALEQAPGAALDTLCAALGPIARRICGAPAEAWLATERSAPGTQRGNDPVAALERDIAMAEARLPPTPGYTVGQVWRQAQPILRAGFATPRARPDTRRAIVDFDAGLKRYSYGPPVRSAHLLRALIAAGLVRLTLADDPEITPRPGGWRLDAQARADVMIDAVLPAPTLESVTDPLIAGLVAQGWLSAFAQGVHTRADAVAITAQGAEAPGLAVLGRLTEGGAIAVDSLHDCFGPATRAWARGVVTRHG